MLLSNYMSTDVTTVQNIVAKSVTQLEHIYSHLIPHEKHSVENEILICITFPFMAIASYPVCVSHTFPAILKLQSNLLEETRLWVEAALIMTDARFLLYRLSD